jgi:hypothetical protein
MPVRTWVAASLIVALGSVSMHADQGERVPDAAIVAGVPQGLFVGRSLLSGRAVCLLFLSDGRVTRFIPTGGLEHFDWRKHATDHPRDVGTWAMSGGELRIAWADGGVHQGPLTVHPDAIEFYGKRYAKPAPAATAAIAGRWESARGTAITGGQGVTRASVLIIQADGRYQWAAATGGTVSGRAVADDRSMTGRLTISGATLTMMSDAGVATSFTFLPAAGTPVEAFSLDANMFTRMR